MDDDELSEIKHNAELGVMAYMDQDELQRSIRFTAEALGLIHGIVTELVGTLPEQRGEEYAPDLHRIAELLPFIR